MRRRYLMLVARLRPSASGVGEGARRWASSPEESKRRGKAIVYSRAYFEAAGREVGGTERQPTKRTPTSCSCVETLRLFRLRMRGEPENPFINRVYPSVDSCQ